MDALRDERAGLKPKMIFDAQMGSQQGVPRDRNAVKKCKDRVCCDRARRKDGSSWQKIVGVNRRHQALRANVHDRLDASQAARTTFGHYSNGCDRQFGKDRMVGNVIEPRATKHATAALPDRGRYRRFIDHTHFGRSTEHEFDFKGN